MTNDELFLSYCAGFFDGEGTVVIGRGSGTKVSPNRRQYALIVAISNTHEGILRTMKERFEGVITQPPKHKPHHKPFWRWMLYGPKAAAFLRVIRPYTVLKSDEIDIGLELQLRINSYRHRHNEIGTRLPVDDAELAARQELMDKLKSQPNRRVYHPKKSAKTGENNLSH